MGDMLADGNVKAVWVLTIANIHLPTVAELNAGTDLSCHITADGLDIKGTTSPVDNTALCSTDDTEEPGRTKYDLKVTGKRKETTLEDVAWNTLVNRAAGYFAVRRGPTVGTAWTAGQSVEIYPVRCGRPVMMAPEKNSVMKFEVDLFNNSTADDRATVAA